MSVQDGQQLAAAAYATAPIDPTGLGPAINGLVYFFSAISTLIVGLRAWVRFGTEQIWGWDDILAVAGYVGGTLLHAFGIPLLTNMFPVPVYCLQCLWCPLHILRTGCTRRQGHIATRNPGHRVLYVLRDYLLRRVQRNQDLHHPYCSPIVR